MVIDDSGDPGNATYTITASTVQVNNLPALSYSGASSLTVKAGSGNDTFTVQGLSSATPVTIDAGTGSSAVNIGAPGNTLGPLSGSLAINGAGVTSVTFNNQGGANFVNDTDTWSAQHVDFTSSAHPGSVLGIDFSNVAGMTLNDSGGAGTNNAHVFFATPVVGNLTINGAAGVPGGAASDFIQADAPAVGANNWRITGHYSGTLNGVVIFAGVDALLTNSSGADVFHFLPGGYMLEVGGATGNNSTLDFSAYTPGITVTLSNGVTWGSVAGAVQVFNAISSIIGTAGNDTFRVPSGGGISGRIVGGGGTDTLDYSAYVGDIVVDLALGTATGVGGGVAGIANVTGSQGNDILVGDANPNVLRGGTGRNLIIGGGGPDQLYGGGGDNILIGGTTAYDGNLTALLAIMAEFDRTDLNFHQRVNDLMNGGGLNGSYVLNTDPTVGPVTVFDDGAADILNAGGSLDWFFVHKKQDVIVNKKPGDKVTQV